MTVPQVEVSPMDHDSVPVQYFYGTAVIVRKVPQPRSSEYSADAACCAVLLS